MAQPILENPFPKNVELKSETRDDDDHPDVVDVHVSLQFNTHMYVEDYGRGVPYYTLAIHGASLAVHTASFEVLEKSKHGKLIIGNEEYVADVERELTNASRVGDSGRISLTEVSAGGEYSGDRAVRTKTQHRERHQHIPVQAVGGNTWNIRNAQGSELNGYVLNFEKLCQCKANWDGQNHRSIILEVRVLARDIKVEFDDGATWLSRLMGDDNGKKIAQVVMAKRIHEANSTEQYTGEVVMARATHADNDA